jgi:hypothetical protein
MVQGAEWMVRRISRWFSPGGILIGYFLALFAATAGVGSFPSSSIALGLLLVVVGAFGVVAISVLIVVYVVLTIIFVRGVMHHVHRLLFDADRDSDLQRTGVSTKLEQNVEAQRMDAGLWDRWIDGFR